MNGPIPGNSFHIDLQILICYNSVATYSIH
jgi:hypothetical protein